MSIIVRNARINLNYYAPFPGLKKMPLVPNVKSPPGGLSQDSYREPKMIWAPFLQQRVPAAEAPVAVVAPQVAPPAANN